MVLQKKIVDFIDDPQNVIKYKTNQIDFTRSGCLSFSIVVKCILHLFKESVEFNLHRILSQFQMPVVSGAAFSKARYKIQADFFKDLSKLLISHYESDGSQRLWKGHRLIAGDGSTLALPASKSIKAYFGLHKGTKSCLAQMLLIYDVLSEIIIDAKVSTEKTGEQTHLVETLNSLPSCNEIILLDGGFGYFYMCQLLASQGRNFCIRLAVASSFAQKIIQDSRADFTVDWHPSESERKTCRTHHLPTTCLKVRVTKVILKDGSTELLVSSLLNFTSYTISDIKTLYNYRWNIEEGIKKMKSKMKIEYFGCKKPAGIFQEFYAHIFMQNLVTIIGSAAQIRIDNKNKHCKLIYKYNWQNAYRFVREKLIAFLNLKGIKKWIHELLYQIAGSVTAIRKHRQFIRAPESVRKVKPRMSQMYK